LTILLTYVLLECPTYDIKHPPYNVIPTFKISENYIWRGDFISDRQITDVVQILNLFL